MITAAFLGFCMRKRAMVLLYFIRMKYKVLHTVPYLPRPTRTPKGKRITVRVLALAGSNACI